MLKTLSTLHEYLQYTEDALSAGRIEEALEHCQYVLSHFPHSLEAHRLLGEIYLAQNRLTEAQQTFDWVLTNDPENVLAYCNRALTSERMGDVETALDCYQQAYELSRGNSQIRQEFNKLSARSGQPGFMFSRAGLARLYMRGDLLFQAIQEWEAVLAATPDRLDARTGLLEACWRDGDYERAEQIATALLEEIPGCLKALLLLAHMTFPHNPARARELLQRAEALDPEMTMARELFGDLMAASPDDPFLSLVRKDAVLIPPPGRSAPSSSSSASIASGASPESGPALPEEQGQESEESEPIFGWTTPDPYPLTLTTPPASSPTPAPSSLSSQQPEASISASSDEAQRSSSPSWSLSSPGLAFGEQEFSWEEQSSWSSVRAAGSEEDLGLPADQAPSHPAWLDALDTPFYRQPSGSLAKPTPTPQPESPPAPSPSTEAVAAQEALDSPRVEEVSEVSRSQPTSPQAEQPTEQQQEAEDEMFPFMQAGSDPEEGWPEWLKSLGAETMEESASESSPSVSSPRGAVWGEPEEEPNQEVGSISGLTEQRPPEPAAPLAFAEPESYIRSEADMLSGSTARRPSEEDYSGPAYSSPATWDELTGGGFSAPMEKPAWLEQLQASHSTFESQEASAGPLWPPEEPLASSSSSPTAVPPAASIWGEEPAQSAAASTPLASRPSASPQGADQAEAGIPWLEQLAGWSTASEGSAGAVTGTQPPSSLEAQASRSEPASSPAIPPQGQSASSWLAELAASASQRSAEQSSPPAAEQRLVTTLEDLEQQLYAQGFVPLQPGELASFAQQEPPAQPTATAFEQPPRIAHDEQRQAPASPAPPPAPELEETVRAPLGQPPRYEELKQAPEPLWPATPGSGSSPAQGPVQGPSLPSYRPDALLEDELETTMKRPVFRLQPAQTRPQAPGGRSSPARPAGREAPSSGTTGPGSETARSPQEGEVNYKEHLIRGYQYQLAGAYDEAMQEYRIVIRNQPELLSEVISNTRALLKLAPKYAPGYRVLGDAYMRQGEYLQAMEAYNKALTMTRRAKGQGAS
ncbi:MAG: tetratricopeptide repeat protein [Thermogemmatispora sp.]|uniref:tetratricopeptide repeat protein n=1 Tax=Thermogemmatispora sp. TaxID=1968838 RepID=UPI001E041300|nr:tetratricopeptide repeat protein [Thermogemmatispora sp.]MBX5449777.1 tetratricopeptide repeat protein [Thermogemmatispora sp.]